MTFDLIGCSELRSPGSGNPVYTFHIANLVKKSGLEHVNGKEGKNQVEKDLRRIKMALTSFKCSN